MAFTHRIRAALIALASFAIVLTGALPTAADSQLAANVSVVAGAPVGLPAAINSEVTAAASSNVAAQLAQELLAEHPVRLPFTQGEYDAAQWISDQLAELGFAADDVAVQTFDLTALDNPNLVALNRLGWANDEAAVETSQNVYLRIPGNQADAGVIVLGAAYDTFLPADAAADPAFGANVGLLLATARDVKAANLPETVYIAFFGADAVGRVGARHFYANLPDAERLSLVVNVDAIGAAEKLFFTADVCDGGERCPAQSAAFAEVVSQISDASGADLFLFKEEDFDFTAIPECPCCVFGVPDSVVGVPVVTLFAFDFSDDAADADPAIVPDANTQTELALGRYQQFLNQLLTANRSFTY